MTSFEASQKVLSIRGVKYNDYDLSEKLGISRPTLYTRIKKHNWKKGELILIKSL